MRGLRALLLILVAFAFVAGAFADNLPDMRVIFDWPPGGSFTTYVISTSPYTIQASQWAPCVSGQVVPAFLTDAANAGQTPFCFTGENNTGTNWTGASFEVDFPALGSPQSTVCDAVPGYSASCVQSTLVTGATSANITVTGEVFSSGLGLPDSFTLGIYGVGTPSGGGIDPSVPEPATLILIPTGLLLIGLAWDWRRRHEAA
ncbi:MAG: PEP-CTERM sorting domain-containing protein [Acidobacteriota bacterium]|nr:PEP-CTERM sorting domain-containing protein [Acidobacteriota bacterium]